MSFSGFSKEALRFYRELSANNSKEWFEDNAGRYREHVLEPAKAFVETIGDGLKKIDRALYAQARVNGSIFRINRDVRFSKDKTPYKTELAFRFWHGEDKKRAPSGFYMRIRPSGVGIMTGVWAFEPAALLRYREAVADTRRGRALARAIEGLESNCRRYGADSLKRVPKPWPADHERADLLRAKGLAVGKDVKAPKQLHEPAFVDWCLEQFERLSPVHRWLVEVGA